MNLIEIELARIKKETHPKTKARNNALAKVKWVLSNEAGTLWAAFDDTPEIDKAIVFDLRDNETMKCRYYSALLKTSLVVELI